MRNLEISLPVDLPDANLLGQAIEACEVSITIADMSHPDGPLTFVNQAFLDTTGYRRDEVIGRNCRFLQGPDTDPDAISAMRNAIRRGESLRIDLLNYRRNGETFWNALHLSPLCGPRGTVRAYIGLQHDVTQIRAARLAEHHRQKIEALGRLAGGVAHEINNLLQPLISLPELVAEDLPEHAIQSRADLDLMVQSARDARDLVAEILTYTRTSPQAGEQLVLAPAIADALAFVKRSLASSVQVTFTNEATEELAVRDLSRAGLQQILTNLILNAAHAMGGAGDVTLRLQSDKSDLVLTVEDDGPGVSPEVADKIFEPFFTTKAAGKGAGLGLYVVFDLVSRAHGQVRLLPRAKGACFELRFPSSNAPHL
ncbi:PAS domain-containing protein [Oceanicaulis sp. 350]|nr:PAS domain-containing protein [Oceanicaulis sp. 350]